MLDASINDDWGSLKGNPAKLCVKTSAAFFEADVPLCRILGMIAILFDAIFIFQHYVLYRDREDSKDTTVSNEHRQGSVDNEEAPTERTRLVA